MLICGFYFLCIDTPFIEPVENNDDQLDIVVATTKYEDAVPIYEKPDENSSIISELSGQTCLTCNYFNNTDNQNNFIKVELSPSLNGYIKTEDCTFDTIHINDFGLDKKKRFANQRIIACQESLKYLTTSYEEMTCNVLVRKAYQAAGIDFGDLSASQYDRDYVGVLISEEQLKPGDLVFYKGIDGGDNHHIGLYLGKGYVIQATLDKGGEYPLGGVHITKLNFRSSPTGYRSPFLD